jgi:hypothetical protein
MVVWTKEFRPGRTGGARLPGTGLGGSERNKGDLLMHDHMYHPGDGREPMPTSQIPTEEIKNLLRDGIQVFETEFPDPLYWVRERLKLELEIRECGLDSR